MINPPAKRRIALPPRSFGFDWCITGLNWKNQSKDYTLRKWSVLLYLTIFLNRPYLVFSIAAREILSAIPHEPLIPCISAFFISFFSFVVSGICAIVYGHIDLRKIILFVKKNITNQNMCFSLWWRLWPSYIFKILTTCWKTELGPHKV